MNWGRFQGVPKSPERGNAGNSKIFWGDESPCNIGVNLGGGSWQLDAEEVWLGTCEGDGAVGVSVHNGDK